jgi:hypothetical protein
MGYGFRVAAVDMGDAADPNESSGKRNGCRRICMTDGLSLFDNDGVFFTDFNAALASEAFFCIDRFGFAVFHLENFYRTNINAFFATDAFLFVHNGVKSHYHASFHKIFHG